MDVINMVICHLNKSRIQYDSIILHGSQAMGFATEKSDFDFLVITDQKIDLNVFVDEKRRKIHIDFINFTDLRTILNNYEKELLSKLYDLNLLAGRIISGIVLYDSINVSGLIKEYQHYDNKDILVKKFLNQSINCLNDIVDDDLLLRYISIRNMIMSVGVAILIERDIMTLSLKWQHRFISKIISDEDFEYYKILTVKPYEVNDKEVYMLFNRFKSYLSI